jgi:hypothetical protein
MKFVLLGLLATLPLAAQMSDPGTPTPDTTPASIATNAADDTPVAAPPLTNATPATNSAADQTFNPAENEPVVVAPPVPDGSSATNAPAETPTVAPVALTPALSPDPFSDSVIAQIVVRYQKAWDGDKKETTSLTSDLERWTKDEPANYLLLAYLGSVYALDSRNGWWGPSKLDFLKKGDKALDDAVKGDPSNPAIRLLRAMNYYELPAMFGKHRAAHDDFQVLLQQLNGVLPMPYALTPDTKQAIYYYAGLSDAQFDDSAGARDAWTRGLALAPTSKLGQKTQAALNKLK